MAIIILGSSTCCICNEILHEDSEIEGFPPFALNENDPLIIFNDAACHKECLVGHQLENELEARIAKLYKNIGPGNRNCAVCEKEVEDHNDYLLIPHLIDDSSNPLHKFNYTHLHRSHINSWIDRDYVLHHLQLLIDSAEWKGDFLTLLVDELKEQMDRDLEEASEYFKGGDLC